MTYNRGNDRLHPSYGSSPADTRIVRCPLCAAVITGEDTFELHASRWHGEWVWLRWPDTGKIALSNVDDLTEEMIASWR